MRIGIPVYDGFDILDVTGPWEMFRWAGFEQELVAQTPGLITCNGGMKVQVDQGFGDPAEPYDALWVPGGDPAALNTLMYGPDRAYLDYLVKQAATAKYVTSVCEGALLLAAAGLLDGYTITTHWAFIPCFSQRFPQVKLADGHPRFWQDRNRLTGGGISSGLDEALALIEILAGTSAAETVQQMTQYYPDPPVSSQIPNTISCPLPPLATGSQVAMAG